MNYISLVMFIFISFTSQFRVAIQRSSTGTSSFSSSSSRWFSPGHRITVSHSHCHHSSVSPFTHGEWFSLSVSPIGISSENPFAHFFLAIYVTPFFLSNHDTPENVHLNADANQSSSLLRFIYEKNGPLLFILCATLTVPAFYDYFPRFISTIAVCRVIEGSERYEPMARSAYL